jgi:hypothetical protein
MGFSVQLFIVELVSGLVAVDGDGGHSERLNKKIRALRAKKRRKTGKGQKC